jgi:hypothetical protein
MKKDGMRDRVAGLVSRRGSSASAALAPRPGKGDEEAAPHVSLLHTTVHITEDQRKRVHLEAVERFDKGKVRRIDGSAVVRDVLDFWIENQDSFTAWLEARKR